MANDPNTYFSPVELIARTSETPNALGFTFNDDGGMNYSSCQPGVGIATDEPNLTGNPEQWTLLDQNGAARTPQNSQYIGLTPTAALIVVNDTSGDGNITGTPDESTLATLAAGWTGVAPAP